MSAVPEQQPEVPVEPEVSCPMSENEGMALAHPGHLMEFYDASTGQAFWGSSCCNWFILLDPAETRRAKRRHQARCR